ncbi:ComEC/Rec2 family competence protein [Flavobacterium haoranii]|uniref:Competence protein ComEC n=1 Tax=Flavobacterium haoranii TaxID=683124 RepID=A0A1M6DNL9_9FLAO|nr:ComEC/Rec2 family competence protein [Flavobacterium haoranii]SHI74743.1 competence protein ComEC [Flavobacterium haoranii]
MKAFPFPLIVFTIFFGLGIVFDFSTKIDFLYLIVLNIFSIAFLAFFWLKAKQSYTLETKFGFATVATAFAFGALIHHFNFEPNQQSHYSKIATTETPIVLKAVVQSNYKSTEKNDKYLVQLQSVNDIATTGKLLVYISKKEQKTITPGDEIIALGKLQIVPQNFNPYQFDYSNYLAYQNIFHQTFIREGKIKIVNHRNNWDSFWFNQRQKLLDSFSIHNWDASTKSIVFALLFGYKNLIDPSIIENYQNSGVIHILAISGLHVGILYLFIGFLLKPIGNSKKGLILKLVLTLSFLWSFAILTGFTASVTRAVTMFSIIAIGRALNRDTSIYNSIAFSALLLLVFKPNFIFDIGFQLSYAAVLSIVAFQPFFKNLYFTKFKIVNYFTDLVMVSLAAQIGVLPLSIYYFNQFPVLFLAANIVIIPLTTAVVITSLATLILNFIFPSLAILLGKLASFCIQLMNMYAEWIASFNGLVIQNISFSSILCVLGYASIITFLIFFYNRRTKTLYYFLSSIIIFQIAYMITITLKNTTEEFIVYNANELLISEKKNNKISFFSNAPETNSDIINDYAKGSFVDQTQIFPIENALFFKNKNVLVIDSLGKYQTKHKASIIVLSNNPTINLERVIKHHHPEIIIADKTNSFYKVQKWKATCVKEKIPFHTTAEKGFYKILK